MVSKHTSSRSGLTLIELLLVMGVLALVLGAGLGSLSSLNPGERAALGMVQDALRSAHNNAISRSAPARVRIDPKTNTLMAEGMLVVGTWHFEDTDLSGAQGVSGIFLGLPAELAPDGWLGRALDFRQAAPGAEVEFPVQDDPGFDLSGGFAIDLALRPEALVGARLLEIAGCVEVDLTRAGGIKLKIHRKATESITGRQRRGAGVTVESEAGVLRPGRWTQLRLQYDRRALCILADGLEVGRAPAEHEIWRVEGPLRIGGGSTPLRGLVDELALAVVADSEQLTLPGDVIFDPKGPSLVQFVAGGALDPTVHFEPVRIDLEFRDGRRETVRVGLYGTVE